MAHVQDRGKDHPGARWKARYLAPDGAERSKVFVRKVDAERFLAGVETDKARGSWTDPRLGRTRLSEWAEEWWATTVDLRRSTRVRERGILDGYLLPAFGARELASITHLEVRAWIASLVCRGLAPRSVRKVAHQLTKVMAAAVDARLLAVSPCERLTLPSAVHEEMRFLTPAEVRELAEAMHPRYRAFVLTGAYGGLRLGELAGLRRRRYDTLRGRLEVAETAVEAGGRVEFGPPKTAAGHRVLTLPAPAVRALETHLLEHVAPEADALVFSSPTGQVLRGASWRRRFWQPAVTAAGLEPLRVHDLRHTAVALWIASGANSLEVSKRAGHASTAFTQDRYGHLYPDADDRLTARLDLLLEESERQRRETAPVRAFRTA